MDQSLAQHQLRPVLQRLGQVYRPDLLTACQVRDRPGQFQDPVIGPRRERHLAPDEPPISMLSLEDHIVKWSFERSGCPHKHPDH